MATTKRRGRETIGDKPLTRSEVTSRYRAKVGAVSVDINRQYRDALKKLAAFEESTLYDVLNGVVARRLEEWETQHGVKLMKGNAAAGKASSRRKS